MTRSPPKRPPVHTRILSTVATLHNRAEPNFEFGLALFLPSRTPMIVHSILWWPWSLIGCVGVHAIGKPVLSERIKPDCNSNTDTHNVPLFIQSTHTIISLVAALRSIGNSVLSIAEYALPFSEYGQWSDMLAPSIYSAKKNVGGQIQPYSSSQYREDDIHRNAPHLLEKANNGLLL